MFCLGDVHNMVNIKTVETESYIIHLQFVFFQGRMLCNDVSYVEILFMAEDWVTSYGQQSVSEVQKVKYFS